MIFVKKKRRNQYNQYKWIELSMFQKGIQMRVQRELKYNYLATYQRP